MGTMCMSASSLGERDAATTKIFQEANIIMYSTAAMPRLLFFWKSRTTNYLSAVLRRHCFRPLHMVPMCRGRGVAESANNFPLVFFPLSRFVSCQIIIIYSCDKIPSYR